MSSPNPLSNSSTIRADSVEVWNPLKRKYEALGESIVGLAPEDLNSIELLAQAIDNGPNYFQTVAAGLSAKADRDDVDADLTLLGGLVDTKASSSALASATAALQAQVDTKASSSDLAALSSTVQTKQDALLQVPADAETEELIAGSSRASMVLLRYRSPRTQTSWTRTTPRSGTFVSAWTRPTRTRSL
jgi:hypothetical protein